MTKENAIKALRAETSKAERFNSLLPFLGGMKAPASFRFYNRAGYSPANLSTLEYDVKQAHNITNGDLSIPLAPKRGTLTLVGKNADKNGKKENGQGGDGQSQNAGDVDAGDKQNVFEQAPDEVKEYVKLRERYPFLNDPDCPEKLHTLVGLNGTAYNQVLEARKELFRNFAPAEEAEGDVESTPMTEKEVFELAKKAVENFTVNVEGEEELDYYKEHGEILGNHPIFADEKLKEKVDALSTADLAARQRNLKNYIGRDFKKHEKAKKDKKTPLKEKVLDWERELRLVEARMEVKPEDKFESKFPAPEKK